MNRRRLLIDAGNTCLKWAVVEDKQWRAQGRSDYADWAALTVQLTAGTPCFIASVASTAQEQRLAALLGAAGISAHWLAAEADLAGVKNSYLNPLQLGVDRWMGLIAARGRTREPVLVVSVGTAMTVDALSADGVFLGGVIVPGIRLMRQALQQGTALIAETMGHWQAFPRSTADAVESGIVAALCGAIQQQHARLVEASGSAPQCLLTGGDASMVLPHLALPAEQVPALVLEGVDCVARERMAR
ncbi:type III pantothenate kinase [Thiobacillus denitrificans]|uniref:Type III pantothenate kinase n=1 Tax=Thiobacillus denitrificans TaxID=36861 RepID=A0A106BVQ2_THIDE|nr:type III pantothenate kinase [Thiobacillus denitrificans]KVW99520.1 pantothenate kinase [Thiobacillus denitrificans]